MDAHIVWEDVSFSSTSFFLRSCSVFLTSRSLLFYRVLSQDR